MTCAETNFFSFRREENNHVKKVCPNPTQELTLSLELCEFWSSLLFWCLTNTSVFATMLEESNSRLNNLLQYLGAVYACYHMHQGWIAKIV